MRDLTELNGWECGGVGLGMGGISERREIFRAIWNGILFLWNLRSSREFHSAGKEKKEYF